MPDEYIREVAKCDGFDIFIEHPNSIMLDGGFSYEGMGSQGFGYDCIDMEFITRLMAVFKVKNFNKIKGNLCYVTHNHSDIKLIEPIFRDDGMSFDVHLWASKRFK